MAKSKKTPQLCKKIVDAVAGGLSLVKACKQANIAESDFRYWCDNDSELAARYAHAREDRAEVLFEEYLEIADTPHIVKKKIVTKSGDVVEIEVDAIEHRRLQTDARKFFLAKLAPKKYGDKVTQEISGPDGSPVATTVTVEFVKKGE